MWKEVALATIKELSQNLVGGTGEEGETPQPE
jgi:hypothetical protein